MPTLRRALVPAAAAADAASPGSSYLRRPTGYGVPKSGVQNTRSDMVVTRTRRANESRCEVTSCGGTYSGVGTLTVSFEAAKPRTTRRFWVPSFELLV